MNHRLKTVRPYKKCKSCGHIFKNNKLKHHPHAAGVSWGVCPKCGKDTFGNTIPMTLVARL